MLSMHRKGEGKGVLGGLDMGIGVFWQVGRGYWVEVSC